MQAAVVKTTVSMNTGKILSREIVDHIEIDENEYYRPLVEVLSKGIEKFTEAG